MSRTVVVALDTSDVSARALPFAQDIARSWRGSVVFVHARAAADSGAPVPLEVQLREVVRDLGAAGVNADFVLRSTTPAQAIIDVANERDADLIVMASHQRRGISRWLNGSVTEDVLAGSNKPVLVIPHEGPTMPASSTMRVLLPLDGSAVGSSVLQFLTARPTVHPVELLLVQVISARPVLAGLEATTGAPISVPDYEEDALEAEEYLSGVHGTIANGSVRHHVVETNDRVADAILKTARTERADVIALGTHAKAGLSRLVLGSVSEEVLERSPIPVLLLHPKTG